jgi:hypothetical protein
LVLAVAAPGLLVAVWAAMVWREAREERRVALPGKESSPRRPLRKPLSSRPRIAIGRPERPVLSDAELDLLLRNRTFVLEVGDPGPVKYDGLSPSAYAELAPGAVRPRGGPPPNGKPSWRAPEEKRPIPANR